VFVANGIVVEEVGLALGQSVGLTGVLVAAFGALPLRLAQVERRKLALREAAAPGIATVERVELKATNAGVQSIEVTAQVAALGVEPRTETLRAGARLYTRTDRSGETPSLVEREPSTARQTR